MSEERDQGKEDQEYIEKYIKDENDRNSEKVEEDGVETDLDEDLDEDLDNDLSEFKEVESDIFEEVEDKVDVPEIKPNTLPKEEVKVKKRYNPPPIPYKDENGVTRGPKGSIFGRPPSGSGLTLKKRLKVLQDIILDKKQKTSDRLVAIKTMTELLSDKIKEAPSTGYKTIISFDETDCSKSVEASIKISDKPNPKPNPKPKDLDIGGKDLDMVIKDEQSSLQVPDKQVLQVPDKQEVTKNNVMNINFVIDEKDEK